MADGGENPWLLKEDGILNVGTECRQIVYHPNLNVLLITNRDFQVQVLDINSGTTLQQCSLVGRADGKLYGKYLDEGVDKILYTDGKALGVRSDYNGVLLLDTILQMPVQKSEDMIKIELLLSEAIMLHHCLRSIELPGVDHVQEVLQELYTNINLAKMNKRKGIKAQKWNTVCLQLSHGALKLVCTTLVMDLKKQNKHIPPLPIASAINERLTGLLPGLISENEPVDKVFMFSEAARRDTFSKWPHMNYKWALPDQMAQAGFYHQPNPTGQDRAMCFTCNVCLVCWEPTDEPWSEHERHSPSCPFVKGEYTQNVPLSVTLATAPAQPVAEAIDIISTTNVAGLIATGSQEGYINIWNIQCQFKKEASFYINPCQSDVNNRDSLVFVTSKTSAYMSLVPQTDSLSDSYKLNTFSTQLTALSLIDGPKTNGTERRSISLIPLDNSKVTSIRPSLVCGVFVSDFINSQSRNLDNVWASSSLVRAMNSVNSAVNNSLDIMKVAGDSFSSGKSHYLVLCDFHHKIPAVNTTKKDGSKDLKTKKTVSGTGTSTSSNGDRQENIYQELLLGKFLLEEINEDVDSEMIGGPQFESIYTSPHNVLSAPTPNGIFYGMPVNASVSSSSLDANSNSTTDQFPSSSKVSQLRKTLDNIKTTKAEPVVVQSIPINAPNSLRITNIIPIRTGKHVLVTLSPNQTQNASDSNSNANQMDVDDETLPKSFIYWEHSHAQSNSMMNGETQNYLENSNSQLYIYALDFSDKIVKLIPEPIMKQELSFEHTPVECILLPNVEKSTLDERNSAQPHGQVALVCKDGAVRLLDLNTLSIIREAKLEGRKFISAAYCSRLERLCACTNSGELYFFKLTNEDDYIEEKDADDFSMITEVSREVPAEFSAPSTSKFVSSHQDQLIAHKSNFSYKDLKLLYELTRFDRNSPAYGATVPPCWSEMMQAQRQRRYPQHLHQSEDQHHTRTWRLQNDSTTWDEHVFELSLPRGAEGNIGHVDVRFSLQFPCLELPPIQVTLLKQTISGIGSKAYATPVDEKIDFKMNQGQKIENPVLTEEYQKSHKTEVLCGPINLQRCMDLSDHSGCITLTSPKLFRTKAKILLVHIKALVNPIRERKATKTKSSSDSKPPTSKKLRIDEAGPLIPGSTIERFAANANKKMDNFNGCDWIHEVSITVRSVHSTSIHNEKLQRCAMLESKQFMENLLAIACLQTSERSPVAQSLALDILIWITAIRLTRLRSGVNNTKNKNFQMETINCIQEKLHPLLDVCLFQAGRSIAHKCIKIIVLCSEGLNNLEDSNAHSFEEAVLTALIDLFPSIINIKWSGSLRWLAVLITRLLPLDKTHAVAQQCINLVQSIAAEMSKRTNPYNLLLATRFGLYNSPFETKLFDMDPPISQKPTSVPISNTYSSITTEEQATNSSTPLNSFSTQDSIDLRDLLSLPSYSTTDFLIPNKLRALCANHWMKGLLEVEPLHFTCHAASDGTKVEKIIPSLAVINVGNSLYDHTTPPAPNTIDNKIYNPISNFKPGSLGPNIQVKLMTKLSSVFSNISNQYPAQKNSYIVLSKKAQGLYPPDDQSDSDETNNVSSNNSQFWNMFIDKPLLTNNISKEKSNNNSVGTSSSKIEDNNSKKKEDISYPWSRLLCWPPQKALVVERMFSGARRFVILDFGCPILLTDLMFPACNYLVSLSIDIWTRSEESDGIRLVVAGDIGTKPLVVSDLQPPPVCRYLKITTIGRYGMATARCKIPLGMFYGHMIILPGEDYSEMNLQGDDETIESIKTPNFVSTIESQCNILSALAEDVQCRFTLATERLKSYLDPLLCSEAPNLVHMQHYLSYNKSSNDNNNKDQNSSKIVATYQECIMYQHQLNIIQGVWQRLESWRSSESMPVTTLQTACTDKLRILGETLLDILIYIIYEIGPVPTISNLLYESFTPKVCENLFNHVCVMTPSLNLQLYTVALLSKMAGQQPWWGDFLANTLIKLYSASSENIFAQDRVFILLTFLGKKSLISNTTKTSVIDTMVRTLGKLLSPLSGNQDTNTRLDNTLISWILLFLSICLDTNSVNHSIEDSTEKSKEPGLISRWEFIQGEVAMQKKFVSSSRSSASRNYRRKLQKRLMHHKQQLQDLEQAKKSFAPFQAPAILCSAHAATFCTKLDAAFKSQEKLKAQIKTFKQHSNNKHFKQLLTTSRGDYPIRSSRSQPQSNTSAQPDIVPDIEIDNSATLSYQYVLPVVQGLVSYLLNNVSKSDMFLLSCKVLAKLIISTRPSISLNELMSEDQLLKLIILATGTSDTAWASHAVLCFLQDLLEAERLYPKNITNLESTTPEEQFESTSDMVPIKPLEEEIPPVAGTSNLNNYPNEEEFGDGEENFVDIEEDTQDSIVNPATTSSPKLNGFNLPSVVESDDSEFEIFLDNILDRSKSILKKNDLVTKYPSVTSSGISQAVDARLEYGVEAGVEIALRRLCALGTFNLPLALNSTVQSCTVSDSAARNRRNSSTQPSSYFSPQNSDARSPGDSSLASLSMLKSCFDKIFTYYVQGSGVNIELVLQLWLVLNVDASETPSTQFDPSVVPSIPLTIAAINGIISAFSWHPGLSLRSWCYALQCLTLVSNQPFLAEDGTNSRTIPIDGFLGGVAGCIIKERNMGSMLLRLLSGSGLNIDSSNKSVEMAGPTLCQALQDFLMRLEVRCDVTTPGSTLGNSLKELLLNVIYQLVQPGGALTTRCGPLDAQCKFLNVMMSFNFINTDIGTAMSISECVGELALTYVRGMGVGAKCCGSSELNNQSGGFGGLYASVLGGDVKQGRPATWDTLFVALIKLVCKLIQTPLPVRFSNNESDMELEEAAQSSATESEEKMNTTDESKVAEQQTSSRTHPVVKPKIPCMADTVLQHAPTMMKFLSALGHCTGSSLAMLLGEDSSSATSELTTNPSVPDAIFTLLIILSKKASNPSLVLNPVYQYLASTNTQNILNRPVDIIQLSEPLLWFILRILDNERTLAIFTNMGGVKVLCENLVNSNKALKYNSPNCSGVIALVMQHLSHATSIVPVVSSTSAKKTATTADASEDGLMNFAPLGTVSWLHPTAQPADVLIHSATPHRRARSAPWSYHFYPDEAWVDLTITLPCAILLKEVELHPHLTSLSTCPSAVALEISREGNSSLTPICPPMPTSGLTFIRIILPKPEVATAVLVRLYKPRDSTNTSLSQIRLLGSTAFGDYKFNTEIIDEEKLTKTSFGWLRLVHQCLSVSSLNDDLNKEVLNSAAAVEGLIDTCCNLLLLPAPSLFTPNLERVLLRLGLYSSSLGLRLIDILLNSKVTPVAQGSIFIHETTTIQIVVVLLEQLCSTQDSSTKERISAILNWLNTISHSAITNSESLEFVNPPAIYIHCISNIIWKANKQDNLNYNLNELLTDDLFDSLYKWSLRLKSNSSLKQSIDAVLCAFCFVRPLLFKELLHKTQFPLPDIVNTQSASISDDKKENTRQTDDGKSSFDSSEWFSLLARSEFRKLPLSEGQLLTIASVARSTPGIHQLIETGLPTLLVAFIIEFTAIENAKILSNQKFVQDSKASQNNAMTDSDKVGDISQTVQYGELDVTNTESIAVILEFFSLTCSEGFMRDWIGKDGSGFWLPILLLLSSKPVEDPASSLMRSTELNSSYERLENEMIKFLSKSCWCHPQNQKLLCELLIEVILQQKSTSAEGKYFGISGFTRRLILQLLLENEKILISVTSETPMKLSSTALNNNPLIPPHPAYPLGHYHHLLYLPIHSRVSEILHQVSGTWLLLLLPNNQKNNEASTAGNSRNRDIWDAGENLVVDTITAATASVVKDKRAKEASNRSQVRGPIIRKQRHPDGSSGSKNLSNGAGTSSSVTNENYLILSSRPNTTLSPDLTVSQLLSIVNDNETSPTEPCLYLTLKQRNPDNKEDSKCDKIFPSQWTKTESTLEVFSRNGGLAVLAKHLPLIYPDAVRLVPQVDKSPVQEQSDADWVKIEHNTEIYEDIEDGVNNNNNASKPPTTIPQVPPHSLAAFGLFLRLPGYSEVLLRDRKKAQCLLRLALGVTDDGEGGDILSSSLAASLPTLPFHVLKKLLDDTLPSTDDGLLLRRTCIEVGAVHLLLNCLAIFTHQVGQESPDVKPGQSGGNGRSDDKSHLYWAKGTGFGTGSTQQSWNVEQALMRQRSEEEHVTVLLEVLASYIGLGDTQKELPSTFTELIARSCLLPALSSYLRNDSVLDMARHIPLYRAVLQLLRAMANTNQLAPLLLPQISKSGEVSIVSLLNSMKVCVDTYVNKINRTKTSTSKSSSKFQEDVEQDEGLATLIPDIQESANIVSLQTAKFVNKTEEVPGPSPDGPELKLRTIEQRYLEVMKNLQFDTFEMITENPEGGFKFVVSYHFESNMRAAGERFHPARVKRLAQEAVTLSTALPLSYSSSVFVRCDTDRLDIMKVLITGPADTPYANGCFEFDVYFPSDYPNSPMMINLETTGRHSVRFNPNLYNDGKVCLSVLNTWHGRPEEKWNAHTSSFLQVLVSIQSLILVSEPYFNEPGYERSRGTPSGAQSSQEYNANICQATVKWAMLDKMRNPCPCFKDVIHTHFWLKRHEIVSQVEGWIRDMEMQGVDRRSGRTMSLSALALRRHYKLLREELSKLPVPEGLEDLDEPLRSPSSSFEIPNTPSTPTSLIGANFNTVPSANSNSAASSSPAATITATTSNNDSNTSSAATSSASTSHQVHHEIDTDVEMEKMVSKVCE